MQQAIKTLKWKIKASFMEYVRSIPDHQVRTIYASLDGDIVTFGAHVHGPGRRGSVWSFLGELSITGYRGMMDVLLKDPALEPGINAEPSKLTVFTSTPVLGSGRFAIADLEPAGMSPAGQEFRVHLTQEGVECFGGVYAPGTDIGSLWIADSESLELRNANHD